jgi:hypothetical protein
VALLQGVLTHAHFVLELATGVGSGDGAGIGLLPVIVDQGRDFSAELVGLTLMAFAVLFDRLSELFIEDSLLGRIDAILACDVFFAFVVVGFFGLLNGDVGFAFFELEFAGRASVLVVGIVFGFFELHARVVLFARDLFVGFFADAVDGLLSGYLALFYVVAIGFLKLASALFICGASFLRVCIDIVLEIRNVSLIITVTAVRRANTRHGITSKSSIYFIKIVESAKGAGNAYPQKQWQR